MVFIQLGGIGLALYPRHLLTEDAHLSDTGTGFGGITLAYKARTKEDVEAVLLQAERTGATILKPAQDVFWGGYSGYFADPDGYPWEVAWNPHFPLSADGSLNLP